MLKHMVIWANLLKRTYTEPTKKPTSHNLNPILLSWDKILKIITLKAQNTQGCNFMFFFLITDADNKPEISDSPLWGCKSY